MKPQKQAFYHRPEEGIRGDCYRTVIACLLDMDRDDIPHSHEDWSENKIDNAQWLWVQEMLDSQGLTEITVAYPGELALDDILSTVSHHNPGLHYMLTAKSATGCNHVVICKDGKIVWDTSLTNAGIVGPADDGFWWISFLGKKV